MLVHEKSLKMLNVEKNVEKKSVICLLINVDIYILDKAMVSILSNMQID